MLHEHKRFCVDMLIMMTLVTECSVVSELSDSMNGIKGFAPEEETFSLESTTANDLDVNSLRKGGAPALEKEHNRNDKTVEEFNAHRDIKSSGRISRQGPKIWDQWGNWSSCTVTCGIGKLTRWRHCIGGSCSLGEKKAQLKTCTLAAC